MLTFDVASARIRDTDLGKLRALAEAIAACPYGTVEVAGHTDTTGADSSNYNLSWQRAELALDQLRKLGAGADRLLAVGYGARRPIALPPPAPKRQVASNALFGEESVPEADAEALRRHQMLVEKRNAANRRVDFTVR